MRVEVRNDDGEALGTCEIPPSVWEPAWRTGWLHMHGPENLAAFMTNNDISVPVATSTDRWTFRVSMEERVVGEGQIHHNHYIQVTDDASAEMLPGFETERDFASGGIVVRPLSDIDAQIFARNSNPMTMALLNDVRGPGTRAPDERLGDTIFSGDRPASDQFSNPNDQMRLEAELRARNPIIAIDPAAPADEHVIHGGERHGSVVGMRTTDLHIEAVGLPTDIPAETLERMARQMAERIDRDVLGTLNSVFVNGEEIWHRTKFGDVPAGEKQVVVSICTTAPGKRDVEL